MTDNKYIGVQGLEELINLTKNSLAKKANSIDILELESKVSTNASSIADIDKKIPTQANSENKLADKAFVNSSISTNTAYFRGTFESIVALESYSGKKTNNDYAFVIGVDAAGNTKYSRYKWNGLSWVFEYDLNNSSFTAEQWAAIQSGITAEILQRLLDATLTPVGTVQAYAGATAPQGYLFCQGQAISKSEYAELYLVIGDLYSKPEDAEDIFRVPDLRETVIVGVGENTTSNIAAHDVYELGEFEDDQLQAHTHLYETATSNDEANWNGSYRISGWRSVNTGLPTGRTGETTHGKQMGLNYIIKY